LHVTFDYVEKLLPLRFHRLFGPIVGIASTDVHSALALLPNSSLVTGKLLRI